MTKRKFKILSWTWGLPMTLIGHIVAVVLRLLGYTTHKWGGCTYFTIGENWGGLDLGPITLICDSPSDYLLNHEFGHAIQNCYWGPLFPIVIAIPPRCGIGIARSLYVLVSRQKQICPDITISGLRAMPVLLEPSILDCGKHNENKKADRRNCRSALFMIRFQPFRRVCPR